MKFIRAMALVRLCRSMHRREYLAQPADACHTAQLPYIPKGADIPKEVPEAGNVRCVIDGGN